MKDVLRLIEVSLEFPKQEINSDLFDKQLERLLRQTNSPEIQNQLEKAKGFDWVGYIASSLRRANIPSHSVDPLTQDIVIRLLIEPGKLFHGEHGNILARFKVSVRNAIINLVEKRKRRRRRISYLPPEEMPAAPHAEPDDNEMIEQFRKRVQEELGWVAARVFDARMDGMDIKSLIGMPELRRPSSYGLKQIVQQIKSLARQFGDEEFQSMVSRAMDAEERILGRRFGARARV